jgi:hypothetical protein
MPRYLVVRVFDVHEEDVPEVNHRSRRTIEERYPEIVWEHSHVVIDDEGKVTSYCVYTAPDQETIRNHSDAVGQQQIKSLHEIAGDVSPADFPD